MCSDPALVARTGSRGAANRGFLHRWWKPHESFLLHIRPKAYDPRAISFGNTWYLGFCAMFLFLLECVTGVILMVYYAPTPEAAYGSIVRLTTEVHFGWLMRDLHRLAGELMIVVVILHMIRVFVSGSYRGRYGFTWLTGVVLLVCTLVLAFSGYLLPWDQLSYWAVTIGTGIADTIPVIGPAITQLLRGGPEFGQDGLLRFYLLHIIAVPAVMALFIAIHYYRISRLHGISLPLSRSMEGGADRPGRSKRPLVPHVLYQEVFLCLLLLAVLIGAAALFYDAPLEYHADPRHTPAQTRAPWFFLWLQGALKLGDTFIMGICFPLLLLVLLCFLPIIGRGRRKPLSRRPLALGAVALGAVLLAGLSVLGLPGYGVQVSPVTRIFQEFAPEEKPSPFHQVGFANLPVGFYETAQPAAVAGTPEPFTRLFRSFSAMVDKLEETAGFTDIRGIMMVEAWQAGLKRITVRLHWRETTASSPAKSEEVSVYLHEDTSRLPGGPGGGKE